MDCTDSSNSKMGNHIDMINETLDACNRKHSMKLTSESASCSNGQAQKMNDSETEDNIASFNKFNLYNEQEDTDNGTLVCAFSSHSSRPFCKQLKDKSKTLVSDCDSSPNSVSEAIESECNHKLPLNNSTNHVQKNFENNVEYSSAITNISNNHERAFQGTPSHTNDTASSIIENDKNYSQSRTEPCGDNDIKIIAVCDSSVSSNIHHSKNVAENNGSLHKVHHASSSSNHKVNPEMAVDKNKGNTLKIKRNSTSTSQSFSSDQSLVPKSNEIKSSASKVCNKSLTDNNIGDSSLNRSIHKDCIQNTDAAAQKHRHKRKSPDSPHRSKNGDYSAKEIIVDEKNATGIKKKSKGSFNQGQNAHGNSGHSENSNFSGIKNGNSAHFEKSVSKNLTSSSLTVLDSKESTLKRSAATVVDNIIKDNECADSISSSCSEHKKLKQSITVQKKNSDLRITLKLSTLKKKQQKKEVINNIIHEVISKGSGPIKVHNANGKQTITENKERSVNRKETHTSILKQGHMTRISNTTKVSQTQKILDKNSCITSDKGVSCDNNNEHNNIKVSQKVSKSSFMHRSTQPSFSKKKQRYNGEECHSSQSSVKKHNNSEDCVTSSKSNYNDIEIQAQIAECIKEKMRQSGGLRQLSNSVSKQHISSSRVVELKSKVRKKVSVLSAKSNVASYGNDHSEKIDELTDKCTPKNIPKKSKQPLTADRLSNSVSKQHNQVNEIYTSSLRVSEIRNTEDKISLTLSRCTSFPPQNKQVKPNCVTVVPKSAFVSTSKQLPKSTSKQQKQPNQICHSIKTSKVKIKDNKKHIPLESDGSSSANALQTSVSLQKKGKLSIFQECSTKKHDICSSQTVEIESKDSKTISISAKDIITATNQSKINCDSVQKKSKKISVSEHSLDPKHHAPVSGPCNTSQVLKVDERNTDFVDSGDNSFQNTSSINTVKKKLAFSTTEQQVQNSEHQNHLSKISTSVNSKASTEISKTVCDASSISSSCPTQTLSTTMLNKVQNIVTHATSAQKGNHCIPKNSNNVEFIFVPLNPADLNSVNNIKQKLNMVANRGMLTKQKDLTNLLNKKDADFIRKYNTHREKPKGIEKISETNLDSASCHDAQPKVITEKLYESSHDNYFQFNPQLDKPKVVVEKNPYLCLGLTKVSALRDSDDDEDDVFDTNIDGANSLMNQGIVEHRKRFRSASFETSTKRSKIQDKNDGLCKTLITNIGKSPKRKKNFWRFQASEKGTSFSDIPCNANIEKSPKLRKNSSRFQASGNGTSFSDIPCIVAEIENSPKEFLQTLYSILFNGQTVSSDAITKIKKNILNFSGFSFAKDSAKYQLLCKQLKRLHFQVLSEIENIFFRTCLVNRSDVPEKILKFLMHPTREDAGPLHKARSYKMPEVSEEHKKLARQLLEGDGLFPKVHLKRLTQKEIDFYTCRDANKRTYQNHLKPCLDSPDSNEIKKNTKETSSSSITTEKITEKNTRIMDVSSPRKKNEIHQLSRQLKSFPDVASDINNADDQTLSLIHVLLFGNNGDGDISTKRQHILEFSGFPQNHKYDIKNRKRFLRRISLCDLKKACKVLHLKLHSQDKGSMINGLLQFIKFPCEVFLRKQTAKDGPFKSLKRKSSSSSSSHPFAKPSSTLETTSTKKLSSANICSPETSSDASFSQLPTISLSSESNTSLGSAFNNSTGELMLNENPPICTSKTPDVIPDSSEITNLVGKPLENFETIRFNVECATPTDLSELYDILFVKPCDSYEIHQKILQFRGFDFSENSMEYHFRKTLISYMNIESVEKIAKFLSLIDDYTHMHKNELADQILKFLVGLKSKQAGTVSNSTNKRTHIVRLSENPLLSPPINESQMALQPFKFKSGPLPLSPPSLSFSPESYQLSRRVNADVSSSSEDEIESSMPLISFANHPSDSRLRKDIKEILILKGFNITMKELVASTYARYPEFDLRYRSNFIKSKARHILSNLPRP